MNAGEGGSAGSRAGDPGPAAGAASGGAAADALNVCGPTEGIAVVPFPKAVNAAALGAHSGGAAGAATPSGSELVVKSVIHPSVPWATFAAGSHVDAEAWASGFTHPSYDVTAAAGVSAAIKEGGGSFVTSIDHRSTLAAKYLAAGEVGLTGVTTSAAGAASSAGDPDATEKGLGRRQPPCSLGSCCSRQFCYYKKGWHRQPSSCWVAAMLLEKKGGHVDMCHHPCY